MSALDALTSGPGGSIALLIFGLILLGIAGDLVVRGAASLASRMRIPDMVVGLTIVAFGTSAPELLVALQSALVGEEAVALSAVVGSNVANILLVLGVPALIAGTSCDQPLVRRNYVFMLGATILLIVLMFLGPIGQREGMILVGLLLAFIVISLIRTRGLESTADVGEVPDMLSGGKTALFLLLGIAGLPVGAHFTVDGALATSDLFGLPKEAVGLVVLALGTSLPELAAATAAAFRRESGLIIGSVIGSNIFNILSIVGITALVVPLSPGPHMLSVDAWIMIAATLLLGPFAMQRSTITRTAGLFFLVLYGAFVYFAFAG
ncbi:MAG: calcium/sodium antiporter [Pseudomonadota bacterium]